MAGTRCRQRSSMTREAEAKAAQGLADLRKGLEELARRAAAYGLACQALARVEKALAADSVDRSQLPRLEQDCQQEIDALDVDIAKQERRLQTAAQSAAAFARVAAALSAVCDELAEPPPAALTPYERAQKVLRSLRESDELAARIPVLSEALQKTRGRVVALVLSGGNADNLR